MEQAHSTLSVPPKATTHPGQYTWSSYLKTENINSGRWTGGKDQNWSLAGLVTSWLFFLRQCPVWAQGSQKPGRGYQLQRPLQQPSNPDLGQGKGLLAVTAGAAEAGKHLQLWGRDPCLQSVMLWSQKGGGANLFCSSSRSLDPQLDLTHAESQREDDKVICQLCQLSARRPKRKVQGTGKYRGAQQV